MEREFVILLPRCFDIIIPLAANDDDDSAVVFVDDG